MVEDASGPGTVDEPTQPDAPQRDGGRPVELIVPKPGQFGATDFTNEETYRKNRNRLANYRWPVGQEADPSIPGTSERDDGWVNMKLDVVEHPDPDPNQRDLLHGGPELKLPCLVCGSKMHIGASKKAKDVLTEGGYNVSRADIKNLEEELIAAVCENGHIAQLRGSTIERLIKRD